MVPILTIIAASIRKYIQTIVYTPPTSDPYLDNVVLSLRMESSDPYYNQVVLGMHMDDTGLTDVKGHTITLNGGAARSATQSKFGGYSAYFDGAGDYLSLTTGSEFNFGTDDFTMELWAYPTASAEKYFITKCVTWTANLDFVLRIEATGYIGFLAGDTAAISIVSDQAVTLNVWTHIAVCRAGGVTKMYVNGIAQTSTHTGSVNIPNDATTAYIGSFDASNNFYSGYMDDFRITQGVSRYTKNFSVPIAAFPEPTNTAIDDTGKTVTTVGGAQYSGVSKYGSGSFYFDGAGDYLSVPNSGEFNFGSGDFTVEMFVRLNVNNTVQGLLEGRGTTNDMVTAMVLSVSSTGKLDMGASSANAGVDGSTWNIRLIGTTTLTTGVWYHVAIVRDGSTWRIFLNGIQDAVGTSSITVGSLAATIYIGTACNGAGTLGYYLNGYIDDLRITKGVARYTANFTPYKILTTAPAGDPLYNYTTLLLKMNGTNGGTTFTDNSYSPKTATLYGNTNTSTIQFKYGTASGYFDGIGDYITFPSSTDYSLTNDFTIEFWFYQTNSSGIQQLLGRHSTNGAASNNSFLLINNNGILDFTFYGNTNVSLTNPSSHALNYWNHLAICRSGDIAYMFVNGALVDTKSLAGVSLNTSTLKLTLGAVMLSTEVPDTGFPYYQGYIDDLRLTKGAARYTAEFQPPGPHIAAIDPDTDQWWLNTVLALRMDGTHGSTTFTDLKGKTITPYGTASISSAVSKFGQSVYFDGTGDYLSIADSDDFFFDTNNFTIEFWYNFTVSPSGGNQYFYNHRVDGGNTFELLATSTGFYSSIWLTGGQLLNLTATCTHDITSWNHFALVRDGSSWTIYKNGTSIGTATASINVPNFSASIDIGRWSGNGLYFNGYLDDYRITKGIARYTAAFTPSEKPLPTYVVGPDHDQYWDKVVLACPFDTNANDARNHTPTLVGNTSIVSTQKMFGTGSAYFDGTGDYITFPDSDDWHLANNDFSIEAWVRPTAYPTLNAASYVSAIVGQVLSTSKSWVIQLEGTSSSFTNISFTGYSDNSTYTQVATPFNFMLNTWYHISVCRSGNLIYSFVDGICLNPGGTAFSRDIQNSTTTLKIGALEYDATYKYYFSGFIDDLRITKGIARRTADFELPTVANILG